LQVSHSFRIGSITKTFTATAVLTLVDRDVPRLEDRLQLSPLIDASIK